jgi:methylaspartate mutase epsilon subunit
VGDHSSARRAVANGVPLNGYPIVAHPVEVTRALLDGVLDESFPIQVRHGSARPQRIIQALVGAGLDATEGGPVSYCLPYGRTPLRESVDNWARSCELLAHLAGPTRVPHLESFGGCLLGQLCPPSLLVALSVLEAMFFVQHGISSVSLSYAQQIDAAQDEAAVRALHRLAGELLPVGIDWHVVLYTYMGVFPRTARGATRLLEASARLAVRAGAQRLIVKTAAEAHRIASVDENIRALEAAALAASSTGRGEPDEDLDDAVYREARAFVDAVLDLGADVGRALSDAFARGYLDIPFCLHPDNAGRSRSFIDPAGRLRWAAVGSMPVSAGTAPAEWATPSSERLLAALHHVARMYDR